jgi:hypothetical protein
MRKFLIGEIAYFFYGVGELIIEPVKIIKIVGKKALAEKLVGGSKIEIFVASLVAAEDLPKELYNFMRPHIYYNITNEKSFRENHRRQE